jgi:hypothetical protein
MCPLPTPMGADKAKWITDFAEPAYSNGYPFDIGFIYCDEMVGRELYAILPCWILTVTHYRRTANQLPVKLMMARGILNQDGGKMIIARQSQSVVPVTGQLGLNRLLIEGRFADEVYYINVTLKYNDEDHITCMPLPKPKPYGWMMR